ncbi:hypothetical protein SH449x_001879 [Pirellulaceae bacterium SH449]
MTQFPGLALGFAAGDIGNPEGTTCGWLGFSLNPGSPTRPANPADSIGGSLGFRFVGQVWLVGPET